MADSSRGVDPPGNRVGLVYDEKMCAHATPDGEDHPECPERIRAIWNKLQTTGVLDRCVILSSKKSDDIYNAIKLVHSQKHVDLIRSVSDKSFNSRRKRIASRFNSIYLNKGSSEAAYLAAGSVVEAVERVASGDLNSAFAVVRPPGHHAEEDEPMGFCLYNNVALATSYILNNRPDLGIGKILIVDWDVHHGNGTQKMFWKDSRVLFFSVHRHDNGTFYPANDDGYYNMIGEGTGTGYNINVPWEHGLCGDADYLAVWDHVLIPVAKEFNPDLVIVSAGFDAAMHDPLGGCRITPYGYSVLLRKLMDFADGKIVLALEGGYNLKSLANSALACVEVLLDGKPISGSVEEYAFETTWHTIEAVCQVFKEYWPSLDNELPKTTVTQPTPHKIFDMSSDSESEKLEEVPEDVIQSLSELIMDSPGQHNIIPSSWRKELKEIDVWYATYGSNMSKARFRCYIEGGQVEGTQRSCCGSMDKTPPRETMWKVVSHRLFFGRDHTLTWGPGGVAFLHPQSNAQDKAYICMYRITLEQFNDVLLQENVTSFDMSSPLFNAKDLEHIRHNRSASLEPIKQGWYRNVVYLGEERGIPIITMTCELSDVEDFKSGKVVLRAPALEYANTLIRGLVEGEQLSETEARKYIDEAAEKVQSSQTKRILKKLQRPQGKQMVIEPAQEPKKVTQGQMRKEHNSLSTRSNPSLLVQLIKTFDEHKMEAIKSIGFEFLLGWTVGPIPLKLSHWVLTNFNSTTSSIVIEETGKQIRIDQKSVQRYLGLKSGEIEIEHKSFSPKDSMVQRFMNQFSTIVNKKTGKPKKKDLTSILAKDLIDLLTTTDDVDNMFKRNFVVLFNTLIVDPPQNGACNVKILPHIHRVSDIEHLNWAKYILEVLVDNTENWKKTNPKYYRGPVLLPVLVYLDRVSFKHETHSRRDPIVHDWEGNSMIERENKEIMKGGFGKGYILDEPKAIEKTFLLVDKKRKKKEKAKKPDPSEEDSLIIFLTKHLEEGKKLISLIASYLKRIQSTKAKKLENNEIFNKTNEVLDGMLKQKFAAENVSTTTPKEVGESPSQQCFWDEATRMLDELEEKMRIEKRKRREEEEEQEERKKKKEEKKNHSGS